VVPGGKFQLQYTYNTPAGVPLTSAVAREVPAFALDRFEVTVGRFLRFADGYPYGRRPKHGDGAYPRLADSGWNETWDDNPSFLPFGKDGLDAMVRRGQQLDMLDEQLPVRGVNWFVAFAFCVWDGGRLPTEAEWAYAASGGDQQRPYPWVSPGIDATLDETRASYDAKDTGPLPVGSKPRGEGAFGHQDLAGNVEEWVLDAYTARPEAPPCRGSDDSDTTGGPGCTVLTGNTQRVLRGGSYYEGMDEIKNSSRVAKYPHEPDSRVGFRCARNLDVSY
jgi:formylglycine-generating enzyme required for sulfatase activity